MLLRSENGGESWRSLCDETHSPSAANFHGLTVDPEVPGGVLVGTDTGEVWRVSDCAEWELCGEGMLTVLRSRQWLDRCPDPTRSDPRYRSGNPTLRLNECTREPGWTSGEIAPIEWTLSGCAQDSPGGP